MHKPSVQTELTADMATCTKCHVMMKKTDMHPHTPPPSLRLARAGGLFLGKQSKNWRRSEGIPAQVETKEEVEKRESAGYYCKDDEACAQRRIDAARRGGGPQGELRPLGFTYRGVPLDALSPEQVQAMKADIDKELTAFYKAKLKEQMKANESKPAPAIGRDKPKPPPLPLPATFVAEPRGKRRKLKVAKRKR